MGTKMAKGKRKKNGNINFKGFTDTLSFNIMMIDIGWLGDVFWKGFVSLAFALSLSHSLTIVLLSTLWGKSERNRKGFIE